MRPSYPACVSLICHHREGRRNRGSPDHDRPGSQFNGVSALAWSRGSGRGGRAPTVYAVSPALRPACVRRSTATGTFSVEKPGTTSVYGELLATTVGSLLQVRQELRGRGAWRRIGRRL